MIEVGNYVIATPSELGNYKIADKGEHVQGIASLASSRNTGMNSMLLAPPTASPTRSCPPVTTAQSR